MVLDMKKQKVYAIKIDGKLHAELVRRKELTGVPVATQMRRSLHETWEREKEARR